VGVSGSIAVERLNVQPNSGRVINGYKMVGMMSTDCGRTRLSRSQTRSRAASIYLDGTSERSGSVVLQFTELTRQIGRAAQPCSQLGRLGRAPTAALETRCVAHSRQR
jgi:hypothetical protein